MRLIQKDLSGTAILRQATPPIPWAPLVVSYGDDFDPGADFSIDDAVGELS